MDRLSDNFIKSAQEFFVARLDENLKIHERPSIHTALKAFEEVKRLRSEIEQLRAEKEAAVKDVETLLGQDEYLGVCWACAKYYDCRKGADCVPEWRGKDSTNGN